MPPRFLGRKYKDRRKQSAQGVENFMHHHLCRATPGRVCRVAIHPVLGDVDIKAAQLDGAKLGKRRIHLVTLASFARRSAITNYVVQTLQNPTIDERCSCRYRRQPAAVSARGYRKIMKISEQNAQRVSNPAIRVAQTGENLLGKGNVSGVIDTACPQSHKVGPVFFDKMADIHRLLVRGRLGNFLSIEVDDETMG